MDSEAKAKWVEEQLRMEFVRSAKVSYASSCVVYDRAKGEHQVHVELLTAPDPASLPQEREGVRITYSQNRLRVDMPSKLP